MLARTARLVLVGSVAAVGLLSVGGAPAQASRPRDGSRFDTWTGYDIGRAPRTVATGDFDPDGAVDVAWARDAFADFGDPDFPDRLRGGPGADTVKGRAGRDAVDGLDGVTGNDTVNGGSGRNHCRTDQDDRLVGCP